MVSFNPEHAAMHAEIEKTNALCEKVVDLMHGQASFTIGMTLGMSSAAIFGAMTRNHPEYRPASSDECFDLSNQIQQMLLKFLEDHHIPKGERHAPQN